MNIQRPTVSVIIPCYNRAQQLSRAIDSVLNQTVQPLEVIVIDDGSSDDSAETARSFSHPVSVYEQANAGAAAARNRGIKLAKGGWIAFLDSDDIWHKNKIERQLQALENSPKAGLIFTDTQTVRGAEVIMPSRFALGGLRENADSVGNSILRCQRNFFEIMLTQSRVITSATMVRRDLPDFVFPEEIWGSEDWALWLSLILETEFLAVDEVLVTMESASDNLTHCRGRGKLHRNDVLVLEKLMNDSRLAACDIIAITKALEQRRAVAIYHSLIRGENREAREILRQRCGLSRAKRLQYLALSHVPSSLLRLFGQKKIVEANNDARQTEPQHDFPPKKQLSAHQ
ncbi:glycosyltransferase [bacterium]|nr:glycosyltransferase [bacterium]